jgi:prophage regulatory protein
MSVSIQNPTSFLRLPQVKVRTGLSRSAIYARIAQGDFPAPVQIGPRSVAWIDSEISAWIQSRIHISRGVRNDSRGDFEPPPRAPR